MTPTQQAFASRALRAMAKYYEDHENERRFQEWKRRRQEQERPTKQAPK